MSEGSYQQNFGGFGLRIFAVHNSNNGDALSSQMTTLAGFTVPQSREGERRQ